MDKKEILSELYALKAGLSRACPEKAQTDEKKEEILSALEKQFGSILDGRDFKYLDLVIFYLETGRADTMKEALQLVDRQVQTNMIFDLIFKESWNVRDAVEASGRSLEREVYELRQCI